MEYSYLKLDWDSNLFNFNVGKIIGPIKEKKDIENIELLFVKNKVNLSYYSSLEELPTFVYKNKQLDFVLVDKKTTYLKSVNSNSEFDKSISAFDNNPKDKNVLSNLAIQSGLYSRFKIDKRIPKKKFEEIYKIWMINSINKIIANEVLVFTENEAIAGFVTLGKKNNRGDIGLLAVDSNARGKGIGKRLLKTAESWFSKSDIRFIQVITQGYNIPACKLYESCGFTVESVEYFYHIWKK